jgi:hypothetical protein
MGSQQPASNVEYGVDLGDGGEGGTNVVDLLNSNTFSSGLVSVGSLLSYSAASIFWQEGVSVLQPNLLFPPSGTISATPSAAGPHTVAVFPQCNQPPGYPLGSADMRLPYRRLFRFGANDPGPSTMTGAANVYVLHGFLGTAPGPSVTQGSYQCHFAYYPPTSGAPPNATSSGNPTMGLIYLDSASANDTYSGGYSQVGNNVNLSNGTCTIHAGTSTVVAGAGSAAGTYGLQLVLDVEFLQLGTMMQTAPVTYYMY